METLYRNKIIIIITTSGTDLLLEWNKFEGSRPEWCTYLYYIIIRLEIHFLVPDQKCVSLLYIRLEIHFSGREPSSCSLTRYKLQIKYAISLNRGTLELGQSVLVLSLLRQAPGRL